MWRTAGIYGSGTRFGLRARRTRRARRLTHHHPVGSRRIGRAHADPVAAGDLRNPPLPDPQGTAHAAGLVIESGEPREVHQFCALAAMAPRPSIPISPSRRWTTCSPRSKKRSPPRKRAKRYIKAVDKGILKVMSKMGISTYQSYCGAQIFDAVGCPAIS